ncbi:hypothetical protein [Leptolyngbya sp. FACHB-16]|uniref:hypothetical protein n=1 Tax=unclassified Leptolyngbya TaxID=2650499 RepID=UPI00168566B7|nr:hypothetical protein [Leptolyngbya sp. FACHB-16]MBD1909317.1 hypothetical protein [Leptolyngbya sp. FACHB-8]MBD2153547.1 hypothetical protein [Leptolyngbya sp. FACHB-16]
MGIGLCILSSLGLPGDRIHPVPSGHLIKTPSIGVSGTGDRPYNNSFLLKHPSVSFHSSNGAQFVMLCSPFITEKGNHYGIHLRYDRC